MDNNQLIKRFRQQESDRSTIQQTWDWIEEYVTPYRGRFFRDQRDEHSIEWRQRQVWDGTAIASCKILASTLHSGLTSPTAKWFEITWRDEDLKRDNMAAQWLRDSAEMVFWALQDSNFNFQVNETYLDLSSFGTSFLVQEEDDSEGFDMVFESVPLKEGYFEADHQGNAELFYRHLKWTAVQCVTKFGIDNVPDKIRESYENDRTKEKFDIIFCVFPRPRGPAAMGKKLAPSRRPYGSRYILMSTEESIGKDGGYYEMPVHAPRWATTSESQWGNSPAMLALNDIFTLNAWVEMWTVASEKQIDPPMFVEENALLTDLDLNARALNVIRNIEGYKVLDTGANLTVTLDGIERYQASVRNYFFVDQLNFPPPQAQPMTAQEARIRYEEMIKLLAPTVTRLEAWLNRVIGRTFNMLARAGKLPEVPPSLQELDNPEMDVAYTGFISRAIRQDAVNGVAQWMELVGAGAANLGPEVGAELLRVPNGDQIARTLGQYLNIDPALMNGEQETQRKKREQEAMAQQMQQAAMAGAEGEAMQAVGEGEQAMQGAQ